MPTTVWKAPFQVNTTDDPPPLAHATATNEQSGSEIVALTGDRVFVAWNDFSTTFSGGLEPPDSVGQILDPLGDLDGGETYLSGVFGDLAQTNVDIAALPNGGFVATYQTTDATFFLGTEENVGFQVFDADGNAVFSRSNGTLPGDPEGVFQLGNERDPSVVAFADGSFMIVYEDDSAGNSDIRGVVIDSSGAEQPSFAIDSAAAEATRPDAVTLSNGDMAVVYQSGGDVLFSVRSDTGGAVAAGTIAGTAGAETVPAVAAVSGGFVAVWQDADGDGAGNAGVKYRLYSNAGVAAGAAASANLTVTAGGQSAPAVTGLADGGFLVAWVDDPSGTIAARRFDAAGTAIDGEFEIADVDTLSAPRLATLSDGRIAISATNDDGTGDLDIYAAIWDPRTSPIVGTAGDDVITSRLDGATIRGREGADTLIGFGGDDFLNGGSGDDEMTGGLGDDIYVVKDAGDTVTELAGEGTDKVLALVSHALAANVEDLTLAGAASIDGTGNGDGNRIRGNGGDNDLTGAAGDDILEGLGGADVLVGGAGRDTLIGGAGADDYRYAALADSDTAVNRDIIRGFAAGVDDVDLTGLGFSSLVTGGFTGVAGQLRLATGANTLVFGDVDGDAVADFQLQFVGAIALTIGDFIL